MGNPKQKWTAEEEEALIAGVAKHGLGKWKLIQKDPDFNVFLHSRCNIDLKDKWRNMSAAVQGSRERLRPLKPKPSPEYVPATPSVPAPQPPLPVQPVPVMVESPAEQVKDDSTKDLPDGKNGPSEHSPQVARIEIPQPESKLESMTKNRKTIQELQQIFIDQENNQDLQVTYTCHAEIDVVHVRDYGWKYESCRNCKKKLDENRMCKKCQLIEEFPLPRYRLMITVKQEDAYATIGLFDKSVEKIVGLPIAAMMQINAQDFGQEKVCERFENCIGQKYVFKLQVNRRGYKQELTGIKVFLEDEAKENQNESIEKNKSADSKFPNKKRQGIQIRKPSSSQKDQQPKKSKQIQGGKGNIPGSH